MTVFRFTPQASDDLLEIWRYIAADNPEAADRVENAVYEACALIAKSPLAGQVRKDLTAHRSVSGLCSAIPTTWSSMIRPRYRFKSSASFTACVT